MKLRFLCAKCFEEKGPEFAVANYLLDRHMDVSESPIYTYTCPQGHTTTVWLQCEKYTLLFDSGMLALRNGYYYEAVASFAASLERFYEYSIRLFLKKADSSSFESTWKAISNQSERQVGAYLILYLKIYGDNAGLIADRFIRFRNSVIHKGYIPTKEETIEYGKAIYEYIVSKIRKYKSSLDILEIEEWQMVTQMPEGKVVDSSMTCSDTIDVCLGDYRPSSEVFKL